MKGLWIILALAAGLVTMRLWVRSLVAGDAEFLREDEATREALAGLKRIYTPGGRAF